MRTKWAIRFMKLTMGAYLGGVLCILIGAILAANIHPVEASPLGHQTATPHETGPDQAVIPTLKCALHNPDGTFTALFGYVNRNAVGVTIPLGDHNYFKPPPEARGQPTYFKPGSVEVAFPVVYHEDDRVTWTLTGPDGKTNSVTASDSTKRCEKEPANTATARPTRTPTEEEKATRTPTEEEEATRTPTERPGATRTPTEVSQPPEASATPVRTDVPPVASATPRRTSVPPANTPTATATAVVVSPPINTSTPTPVVVRPPSSTSTATAVPSLPPPAPAASITPALIPVTGADQAGLNQEGLPTAKGLVDFGMFLVGLGVVLTAIWLKLAGRG
jgi:hypothetical protein